MSKKGFLFFIFYFNFNFFFLFAKEMSSRDGFTLDGENLGTFVRDGFVIIKVDSLAGLVEQISKEGKLILLLEPFPNC